MHIPNADTLPENVTVIVEKNRWRVIWAVLAGVNLAGAVGWLISGLSLSNCQGRRRLCSVREAEMILHLSIAGSCLAFAVFWFAIWWATHRYRPALALNGASR